MAKISVIVPIYNAELYLQRCVDSLISQTFNDIEIILVNDGSVDGSFEICNKYASLDSRVKVINQVNQGAGVARMNGVKNANSPFIAFIDADDYVESDFCLNLLTLQNNTGADLVECAYNVIKDKCSKKHGFLQGNKVFKRSEFKDTVIKGTIISGTEAIVLWNKLYRKDLFLSLVVKSFSNVLEDYVINMQYYKGVNIYAYIDKPLVNYRITDGSLSRKFNRNLFDDFIEVAKFKLSYMQENGYNSDYDMKNNAVWFMNYLENYLVMGLSDKTYKPKLLSILSEGFVKEQALLSNTSFSNFISVGQVDKALKYLTVKSKKQRLKYKLHNIKCKIKNLFINR